MTTGGKPQGVRVITASDLQGGGGAFRVLPGPATPVTTLAAGARGVNGSLATAVYVVNSDYVNAHGMIGGEPMPVVNIGSVRAVEHPLIAVPVYVVEGAPLAPVLTFMKFWLPCDEATGAPRVDVHAGHIFTGTTGSVPAAVGKINNAVGSRVTGNQYLRCADANLATGGLDFCISGWMQTVGSTQFPLISRNSNPSSPNLNRDWEINFSDLNAVATQLAVRNRTFAVNGSTAPGGLGIAANTYFFFAAWCKTVSPTQVELGIRVNTTVVTSTVATPTVATSNPQVMIGRRDNATTGQSNGNYDELAYWVGYVPTASELDIQRNSGNGLTYAQFVEAVT